MKKLIALGSVFCGVFILSLPCEADSAFDSGQTPEQIAADILAGAKDRYQRQQNEKNNIVMYATSWCGYCRKARNYFHANGIQYTEHDIESDDEAKRRFDLLGGKGVPLILVGGTRMQGFSEARFNSLYSQLPF